MRADVFTEPPDPGPAGTLDDLVARLRSLRAWAGDPSHESIKDAVNRAWTAAGRPPGELVGKTTVVDCFRVGRRRWNADLVLAIVEALHPEAGYVTQWRQALQVVGGHASAAAQVRIHDGLPPDLAGFTGRAAELDRLLADGGAVAVIAGMAGAGKTRLAVRAGHLLGADRPFDRVLFVNLRGFHPDPAQPPADPAAVLDAFLRVLGVPGHQIPHELPARAAAYRARLAGTRTLVVLDDAADENQVRPLLPGTAGCRVLVTSRNRLPALEHATHLTVGVFTPDEAARFVTDASAGTATGDDADAADRIAARCGYLPLALGLAAARIGGTPGWTLSDHADRLDERHRARRLDTGVQLALDLSYQHLPADQRRLLRLCALHPGTDLGVHAAAALAGADLAATAADLGRLADAHLLEPGAAGRYTLHDLVRAHAADRAADEDPPPVRRAALTRLFDHYVTTAAVAVAALYPAGTEAAAGPEALAGTSAPAVSDAAAGPWAPDVAGLDAARTWLDAERSTMVAVAARAATDGWPAHAVRLSGILFRYLDAGHGTDALAIHSYARDAAHRSSDHAGQARALIGLGGVHIQVSRYPSAAACFAQALALFEQVGDPIGEARALGNLGNVEARLGRYAPAADHFARALARFRQVGDAIGEARALINLGAVEERLGRYEVAADHLHHAVKLAAQAGDRTLEADALSNLGTVEERLELPESAVGRLEHALVLHHDLHDRAGEAWTHNRLGLIYLRLTRTDRAAEHFELARTLFHRTGIRDGEAWALNGLGEAADDPGRALAHHTAALVIVTETGVGEQQARAHAGLARARLALGDPATAREHFQQALDRYTELGAPEADQVRAGLTALDR